MASRGTGLYLIISPSLLNNTLLHTPTTNCTVLFWLVYAFDRHFIILESKFLSKGRRHFADLMRPVHAFEERAIAAMEAWIVLIKCARLQGVG